MTPIKRRAAEVGAAILLVCSFSACSGPPDDASKEDFCDVVHNTAPFELSTDLAQQTGPYARSLKSQAEHFEDVGTPEDIPDDAREGFEIYIDALDDVDADDLGNPENLKDEYSEDDPKVEAFFTYQNEICVGDLGVPTDFGTE